LPAGIAFDAVAVSIEEDEHLWRVAFADAEFNARRYLLLERSKMPDALDAELGLDGYSVELDAPSNACYGGVELFELFPDRAIVTFEGGAMPGIEGELVVRFALRGRQLAQLRGCLARIFDGYGCFVDAGGA
jgi:Immunity protein 10